MGHGGPGQGQAMNVCVCVCVHPCEVTYSAYPGNQVLDGLSTVYQCCINYAMQYVRHMAHTT